MNCSSCDFSCVKRGDWNRHLKTKKHLRSHHDLRKIVMDQQEQLKRQQEQMDKISPVHITIFLEQYKDAMNWEDFISTLELWSPNIISLIVTRMKEIGVYRRPIHCIQQQVCIKQQDKWELDTHKAKSIINTTTDGLRKKYLMLWEKEHPEWYKNEMETDEYTSFCTDQDVHKLLIHV